MPKQKLFTANSAAEALRGIIDTPKTFSLGVTEIGGLNRIKRYFGAGLEEEGIQAYNEWVNNYNKYIGGAVENATKEMKKSVPKLKPYGTSSFLGEALGETVGGSLKESVKGAGKLASTVGQTVTQFPKDVIQSGKDLYGQMTQQNKPQATPEIEAMRKRIIPFMMQKIQEYKSKNNNL